MHLVLLSCAIFSFMDLNQTDFSVVSDGSPTEQGVDHRQVQKELGEVSIYLQRPVVLSPTSARISWTVSVSKEKHYCDYLTSKFCSIPCRSLNIF